LRALFRDVRIGCGVGIGVGTGVGVQSSGRPA